jgi:hypothetical protein
MRAALDRLAPESGCAVKLASAQHDHSNFVAELAPGPVPRLAFRYEQGKHMGVSEFLKAVAVSQLRPAARTVPPPYLADPVFVGGPPPRSDQLHRR